MPVFLKAWVCIMILMSFVCWANDNLVRHTEWHVLLFSHTIRCLQLTLQAASTMCSDQGDSLLGKTPNMDLRHTGFWCPTTKRMNQNAEWSQSWAGQQTNCSLRGWLRCCGLLRYLPDDLAGVECCKARVVIAFYWGDFFSFFFFAKFDLVHQESLTAC